MVLIKRKRRVIKSAIQRSRNRFNISIIESGFQDIYQPAEVSIVFLAANAKLSDSIRESIIKYTQSNIDGEITKIDREIM